MKVQKKKTQLWIIKTVTENSNLKKKSKFSFFQIFQLNSSTLPVPDDETDSSGSQQTDATRSTDKTH